MIYTIEIPDDQLEVLAEAVCARRGWTPTIQTRTDDGTLQEVPNPKTQNDVLREATARFWSDEVLAYRASQVTQPQATEIVLTIRQ